MIRINYHHFGIIIIMIISYWSHAQNKFYRLSTHHDFYYIINKMDSIFNSSTDSIEDDERMFYERWKYFWRTRVDSAELGNQGSFKYFLNAQKQYADASFCTSASGNWGILGPGITPRLSQDLGIVVSSAIDPINSNIIYLGTNASGLWKTINANATNPTWVNVTDNLGMTYLGIQDIAIDPANPNTIYVATGVSTFGKSYGIGVIKSSDGGGSWNITSLYFDPTQNQFHIVYKLLIDPMNTNTLYAAVDDKLYRTTDGGNTWNVVYSLPNSIGQNPSDPNSPARFIRDIEFKPNDSNIIYLATDNSGVNNGGPLIIKFDVTLNNGNIINTTTLSSYIQYSDRLSIDVIPSCTSCLYVLSNNCLLKSSDEGLTFTLLHNFNIIGESYWYMELRVNNFNDSIIYVAGTQVAKSINGGQSWTPITDYISCNFCKGHGDIRNLQLLLSSNNGLFDALLMCNDGGASISIDGGAIWKNITTTLPITQFYDIAVSNQLNDFIVGGTQDNNTYIYNNNSWSKICAGDGGHNIIDENNNTFYSMINSSIVKSLSCTSCFSVPDWYLGMPLEKDPFNNYLYSGGQQTLYRYDKVNCGASFSQSNMYLPSTSSSGVHNIAVSSQNNNIMYVSYSGPSWNSNPIGLLYKTSNAQQSFPTWTDITQNILTSFGNNPFSWNPNTHILIHPEDSNNIYLTFGGFWIYRVIKSTDGGQTWINYSNNLPSFPVNTIIYEKGSNGGLYVGTDVGVFYTNNKIYSTQGWVCFSNNMPICIVTDLEINYAQNKIYAATFGRGVWKSDLACPTDYDLAFDNSNVSANNIFYEAENNIMLTANAGLLSVADFTARAGNEIVVSATSPIDEVVINTDSWLFIHPCNHSGNSFRQAVYQAKHASSEISHEPAVLTKLPDKQSELLLYPNPVQEHLHINFFLQQNSTIGIDVYNSIGEKVQHIVDKPYDAGNYDIQWETNNISDGVYFIRMTLNNQVVIKPVIKMSR